MNAKTALLGIATNAFVAVPAAAGARTQILAVGSSAVYPFAKMVAERDVRANLKLGTPIIESTGLRIWASAGEADARDLATEVGGRD